jgi:hypothetical protein
VLCSDPIAPAFGLIVPQSALRNARILQDFIDISPKEEIQSDRFLEAQIEARARNRGSHMLNHDV